MRTEASSLVPSISTVFSANAASASSGFSLRSAGRRSTSTCSSRKLTVFWTGRSLTLVVTRTPPLATLRLPTESCSSTSCAVSPRSSRELPPPAAVS